MNTFLIVKKESILFSPRCYDDLFYVIKFKDRNSSIAFNAAARRFVIDPHKGSYDFIFYLHRKVILTDDFLFGYQS